jgi:ABC-type multidrug transport system fused ATPase/permease subunit
LNKAYEPMAWIMRMYDETLRQMRSVKRLFETLDTKPSVIDIDDAKALRPTKGEISLANVFFQYPDNRSRMVIRGVSLNIPSMSTVAIVGKSGSGKTTLAKLLVRFYDPTNGSISIDGQDIKSATQISLRENIGYVLQDSSLFNDTALNNIRFSRPNAKLSDVVRAAKLANADDFISKLPKGYKTIVGERGVKLSGGEQQRINIARAILKNPPILILDEATSSLDSESELLIQRALDNLLQNKTTIIIAHRLSTVMKSDLIVVMDKGKIVETGTHSDLVDNKNGIYKRLYDIQSGGYLT